MTLQERFLRYVKINTTSDENGQGCPSAACEWELARLLADEMRAMGVSNVRLDAHAYVYGEIPANCEHAPAIGLIAHMDTVDCVPTVPMRARIVENYDGGAVTLENGGTTVLGADDKAGVAEIMTLCERVLQDGSIRHGKICIGFTPDEEIGSGADLFDVPAFGADFAYTVDGGEINELEYENFNAASAKVTVHGRNIHPGSAKNRMKHAARIAMEFNAMLPVQEKPEYTEGYEGFYHLTAIRGDEENAEAGYILRDHDAARLEQKKRTMQLVADFLNARYGAGTVELALRDSYRNMREVIEQHMDVIERAQAAIRKNGLEPRCVPIRGGTDGARLSFMGLPCPNLGTGGANCHGIYEYAAVENMEKMVDILLDIVRA